MTEYTDFPSRMTLENIERLPRIEERLTALNATMKAHMTDHEKVHADMEKRLRDNERFRMSLPVSAVASTVSAIGAITAVILTVKGG